MGFIQRCLQGAEEGLLNIAGNVDFLNSDRAGLTDFFIRIVAAAVQNQRNRCDLMNLLQQLKLQLRDKAFGI